MDSIDKKIVELLQENARIPLKSIAEQVFLSSPAVSARIEHLEKENIIRKYEAKVSSNAIGLNITAFINLDIQPSQKEEFYPFIEGCPNVIECNCVTGDFSMLIKVAFKDTVELDKFIDRLQRFGRTCTQIVFSTPVENRGINIAKVI